MATKFGKKKYKWMNRKTDLKINRQFRQKIMKIIFYSVLSDFEVLCILIKGIWCDEIGIESMKKLKVLMPIYF